MIDSSQGVHDVLYDYQGKAPLTTIAPGVVINSVLQISRIAIAFPSGSPLKASVNEGLRALQKGATVFRSDIPQKPMQSSAGREAEFRASSLA
eukprot:scaffold126776_cov48-Prasinocladus_malaysianus.AAC.1